MLEHLKQQFQEALKKLKGQEKITELNIAPALKTIRRALVAADVEYKIAKEFVHQIRAKALGAEIRLSVSPGQLFTKMVHDELTALMGQSQQKISLQGEPPVVMVAGLQGAGKTTFVGKLAHRLQEEGHRPLLVACDVYRPAAIEQLTLLAKQIGDGGVEVYQEAGVQDVIAITDRALAYARKHGHTVCVVDTAGRQQLDVKMMAEIQALKAHVAPSETLFVVDAMTGQMAVQTAQAFHDRLAFDGVVLTKLDGDTRGGAALSIRKTVEKPIKYISVGEKMVDLEDFHPERMAKRMLGMNEELSIVERAQRIYDQEEAQRLRKKIHKNQIDFDDLRTQLSQLKRIGSIQSFFSKIPTLGKFVSGDEEAIFKDYEVLINSMTPRERATPKLLKEEHRKLRLAKGSGLGRVRVNKLLKQFDDIQKNIKKLKKKGLSI